MSDLVCEHGSFRRKCEICERDDRIKELEEALRAYGVHGATCQRRQHWAGDPAYCPCTCGFERVLRGEDRPLDASAPSGGQNPPLERRKEEAEQSGKGGIVLETSSV